MTSLQRLGIIAALIVAAGGIGWMLGNSHGTTKANAKAQAAQTQSDQHEGAAQIHAAQAGDLDRQAAAKQAAVSNADSRVASAKRELARLQAALPDKAPASIEPLPAIPAVKDSLTTQLAAAEQVITAQDEAIKQRDQVIAALTASRDQWKAAYTESQKALALEVIAKDAAVHQAQSSGLRAQLVRGLEGLAIGYAAGRLTR